MNRFTKTRTIFISNNGIKFERRDFKKRSEVKVIIIASNRTLNTYRFNNIELNYDTKYMNYANVNCCGGWIYDENYLITAVQNNSKLYAGIHITPEEFENLKINNEKGIIYGKEGDALENLDKKNYYICKEGKVSEYIDIEAVFSVYENLGISIPDEAKKIILDMANEEIYTYSSENNKFKLDYVNSRTLCDFIFTGMLLGYPIETTASIIQSHRLLEKYLIG